MGYVGYIYIQITVYICFSDMGDPQQLDGLFNGKSEGKMNDLEVPIFLETTISVFNKSSMLFVHHIPCQQKQIDITELQVPQTRHLQWAPHAAMFPSAVQLNQQAMTLGRQNGRLVFDKQRCSFTELDDGIIYHGLV